MSASSGGKRFYGWRIVWAGCALQAMVSAFMHQGFGAYVAVLSEVFGWSKTALAGGAAIQQLESALLGPLQGWFVDRFGARNLVRIGMVVFGVGLILFSLVDSLPMFYAAFVVIALGSSLAGYFSLTVVLVHWFEKKRAQALSMLNFGFAAGGVMVPLLAWSLVTFGWRETAFATGIISILVGLPLANIVRNHPRDMGERVDGERAPPADAKQGAAHDHAPAGFTVKQALRTRAFWFIALGHAFALLVVAAVNVHAITHMKEGLGYSVAQGAFIIGVITVSQVGGIAIGWWVGDRYEKRLIAASCMAGHMIGMLILTYAVSMPMLVAFAVVHGCAWGLRGSFMHAIRADYFGTRAIGMIMGFSSIIVVLGGVGGPVFAGLMADINGNYRVGFTVLALLSGLGTAFFVFAKKPKLP